MMSVSFGRYLCLVLGAMLVLGFSQPGQAQYTKLYKFTNSTAVAQTSVRAVTNGLEVIASSFADPTTWLPVKTGTVVISGVYCSTLTYGSVSLGTGTNVTVGWTTSDNSCRLRDLRWGSGTTVVPTQLGGTPGGGYVVYDYPLPGDLMMVITNDTEGTLNLSDMSEALIGSPLTLPQLDVLAEQGFVSLYVQTIGDAIKVLRSEVVAAGQAGKIKMPAVASLVGKLDNAAIYMRQGQTAYLAGNINGALFLWGKAVKVIDTFISQLTTMSTNGSLTPDLYKRWIVDGGGQIMTARQIRAALAALPDGSSTVTLSPLPAGTLPTLQPDLAPGNYVPWPTTTLSPGQYTAFYIPGVDEGNALVLRGTVRDGAGNTVLYWIEQGVVDSTPPASPAIGISTAHAWTKGDGSKVGDVVTYTDTVTNTGDTALTQVTVNDDKLGAITLNTGTLVSGGTATGTATLTLTQALLDAGSVSDVATAIGMSPLSQEVAATATDTVIFTQQPAIAIAKTHEWTMGDGSKVGDIVTYTYTVTNTGNVTLDPVTVNDDQLGAVTLDANSLAPGGTATGTATLTLTQALLDAGSVSNVATAVGMSPLGQEVTTKASDTVTFIQQPAIDITVTHAWTTGDGFAVGDIVTYSYSVTNTGNVTLNPVTVNDDQLGAVTLDANSLAPGGTATGTATLTMTQALLDAGSVSNAATATGTSPLGEDVTAIASDKVTFTQFPAISITIEHAWTAGDGSAVGDIVTYTYEVKNTGNVTLAPLTVSDDQLGAVTLEAGSLVPAGKTTGTAALIVTQALLDDGSVTNVATATGTSPLDSEATATTSDTVLFTQQPAIGITNTHAWTTGDGSTVGDVVTYTFTVTNTGNVTLDLVTVSDDQLGAITLDTGSLTPDGTATGTAELTLTQALLDAGSVANTATATGTAPLGEDVTATAGDTVTFTQQPAIDITVTHAWTTGDGSMVGHVVTYTFTVTNIGNVTLNPATISDDTVGAVTLDASSLTPGGTATGTATLTLTRALYLARSVTNIATATGTPPLGEDVTATASDTVEFPDNEPPTLSASITPSFLWPPDHTMVQITLDVTVADNIGAVWYIESVTSNQPDNGTGDGDLAPDWFVDPDDLQSLWLRAERSGNHPEETRLYTVTLRAIDVAGNLSAPCIFKVPVIHNQ